MKRIVILGCTGSIGKQTIDVVSRFPDEFTITGLSAAGSDPLVLVDIARATHPHIIVVMSDKAREIVSRELADDSVRVLVGEKYQTALAGGELTSVDLVLSAISGTAGLAPAMAALNRGIPLALANKETLVAGGELVIQAARKTKVKIFPVDSEHSAIQQCLKGLQRTEIDKIILTCSGGPFHADFKTPFSEITPETALAHPTWRMGNKISIDSATLMNKGLEIIEAGWLFDFPADRIDVVIHRQSIIHSMVQTTDGSVIAQMSLPDMRLPILYALTDGVHWDMDVQRLDFSQVKTLTFDQPDMKRFPCLRLAYEAMKTGGTMPAVMNAANEIAVALFLQKRIGFTDIPAIIQRVMEQHSPTAIRTLEQITEVDRRARSDALRTANS